MSHESAPSSNAPISRRTALRAGVAAGAVATVATAASKPVVAQGTEQLEVLFTPVDPVSVVRAGSGPPQRGDHFYIDAPIFAVGDVNGTQIGTYQCFGVWTTAADATDAPNQRLTTVQFMLADGAIMGLINEAGADSDSHVGAVQGGTGRFAGAQGTFQQLTEHEPEEGAAATPGAAGTPGAGQLVVRAVFDLMLPESS